MLTALSGAAPGFARPHAPARDGRSASNLITESVELSHRTGAAVRETRGQPPWREPSQKPATRSSGPERSRRHRARPTGRAPASCGTCSWAASGSTSSTPTRCAESERPEFTAVVRGVRGLPRRAGRPGRDRRDRRVPARRVLDGLRRLGAFGMKIPAAYGGLGFSQVEYGKVMSLLGSVDANLTALLSAHQSIGVPQPLRLFGSEELKKKYLPRIARGAITAFALTEPTWAPTPPGCPPPPSSPPTAPTTSSTGRSCGAPTAPSPSSWWSWPATPRTDAISAFVVETAWRGRRGDPPLPVHGPAGPGQRGHPLHGRAGSRSRTSSARKGAGLKIALTTLNTGRLSLPAAVAGGAKVGAGAGRASGPPPASSGARRSGSTRPSRTSSPSHRRHHLRDGVRLRPGPVAGRPARLRHPPGGGGGQGVEHGPCLAAPRRGHADPRRARLRDRALAGGARRGAGRRSSAGCATAAST